MTVYSYKVHSESDYRPYDAEAIETLPVGEYTLRVETAESRYYYAASAETDFFIVKAPHDNVEAGPFTVQSNTADLFVNLSAYLEEGAVCTISDFSGDLISAVPTLQGAVLQFTTSGGESGAVRLTVSSANYQDYFLTVLLEAGAAFQLRFDSNGGSAVTETRSLHTGTPYGTLPIPTRIGYTFEGWYSAPEDGERASATTVMGSADTTLYAHWSINPYTVTLHLNGGTLTGAAEGWTGDGDTMTRTFQIATPDFMLPQAVQGGYSFVGWTQDDGEAKLEVTVYQGTTQNLTYEAVWLEDTVNGEVEFVRTDESSGILGIKDLDQDEDNTQKSTTEDDGYRATSLANAMKEIAADIAAQQTAEPDTQKDITVILKAQTMENLTQRDGLSAEEERKKQEQIAIQNKTAELYTTGEEVRQDFLEINMERIITSRIIDESGTETDSSTQSEELHEALRVVEIPLRYDLTGRYNPMVFRFHNGLPAAFKRLMSRPRTYQNRDGYFYVSGRGNDAVVYLYTSRFSTYSLATSDTEAWTVFFDTDGGTEIPHQSIPTTGERKVTRPADPFKAGYTFDGWYILDSEEEKPFNFDTDTISDDITIYAKWTENAPTPTPVRRSSRSNSRTYYTVTPVSLPNGTIKTSVTQTAAGSIVTITLQANAGYTVGGVTVKTTEGQEIPVTRNADGTFSFTQPASNVTITPIYTPTVSPTPTPTPDIDSGYSTDNPAPPEQTGVSDWFITDTHPAYIQGFSDGSFRPESNITRAQTAVMFYRLLKNQNVNRSASFSDMDGSEWYAQAVYTLSSLDVIQGYSDGTFHGNDRISRAAFTAIAARFARKTDFTLSHDGITFRDVPETHWAWDVISRASTYGWIGGYDDGTFQPSASITRAAVVAIINRMLGRNAEQAYVMEHYAELNHFNDVTDSGAWYFYNIMEAANTHNFTVSLGKEQWNR